MVRKKKPATKIVGVRMNSEEIKMLDTLADHKGQDRSDLIRTLVRRSYGRINKD